MSQQAKTQDVQSVPHKFRPEKMTSVFSLAAVAVSLLLAGAPAEALATDLTNDGAEYTLDYLPGPESDRWDGLHQDFTIPLTNPPGEIILLVKGGNGGKAKIREGACGQSCQQSGGRGAEIGARFTVGHGPNQLKPGGLLRFVIATRGANRTRDNVFCIGSAASGGGGGSAVIYKAPGDSWSVDNAVMLLVAGGGGGAHQGMLTGGCVDFSSGKHGRTDNTCGSGGRDGTSLSDGGPGGCEGEGGFPTDDTAGGAGWLEDGKGGNFDVPENKRPRKGKGPLEPAEFCGGHGSNWGGAKGGYGFGGGGGHKGGLSTENGGGGGGYSGGGAGGDQRGGGGGGSFINSSYALASGRIRRVSSSASIQEGFATYQTVCSAQCRDIGVTLDAGGNASITANDVSDGSSGCGVTLSLNRSAFTCADIGENNVTLTATDSDGNMSTCMAIVTVSDGVFCFCGNSTDTDEDGIFDCLDNCLLVINPDQRDVEVAGAISVWRFDEATGTTAIDSFGSNDGTILGGDYAPGKVNTALEFDGLDDYVAHSLAIGTEGTLVHWLRPTQIRSMVAYYESNGTSGTRNGFSHDADIREIHSSVTFGGQYHFLYQDGPTPVVVAGGTAALNTWAHVAVTWDTAGDLILFVEGVEVDSQPLSTVTLSGHAATVRRLGRVGNAQTDRHWHGLMDEIAVFSRALTADEINDVYTLGLSDGVGDACDICPGHNDNGPDGDGDGVADFCDICPGSDDTVDADADGVPDGCDICPGFDDNGPDTDADGVPDGCDVCEGSDDNVDSDGDGVPDSCDNCPTEPNSDQLDGDAANQAYLPIAIWQFEDGSGAVATDNLGNWDGTVVGAGWTIGRQGGGLDFDGSLTTNNQRVEIGDVPELSNVSAFTVALWFQRRTDRTGDANQTNHNIDNVMIAKSSITTNDNLEIGSSGADLEIYLDTALLDPVTTPYIVPGVVVDGEWTHLVLTYDAGRTDEVEVYINGVLEVAESQWGGNLKENDGSPLTLGVSRQDRVDPWGDFDGLLDEVAIFGRALSDMEVATIFLGLGDGVGDACDNCPMVFNPDQANADTEGIIAVWRFDEGNGITALDSVGSTNGTLSGATFVTGALGHVVDFDGDNDWVDFGDVDALDSPGAFSVAMRFLRRSEIDNPTNHNVRNVLLAQSSNSTNDNLELGSSGGSIVLYMDTPGSNGTASISVGSPIQDNTWYHLVLTYDENELPNELKLYIDGAQGAEHADWGGPLRNSVTSALTIGVARPGASDPAGDFDGQVDDVVLFDRALTLEEVQMLFDRGVDAVSDAFGDACDICLSGDDSADADADGVPDACDNCPNSPNAHNIPQGTMHATIQGALDAAVSGDVIELGACTFNEWGFVLHNKDITIRGQGRDQTIIDAGYNGRVFRMQAGDDSIIEDLTIRRGVPVAANGGGAVSIGASCNPVFRRVDFRECDGTGFTHAAIDCVSSGSFMLFESCRFMDNFGSGGASVYGGFSTARFVNCLFAGNSGAGTTVSTLDTMELFNCTFADDTDGIAVYGGGATVANCAFDASNTSGVLGGGATGSRSVFPGATGDNIDGAPTFVDAPGGDYRLAPGSLGIDAADHDAYVAAGGGTTDLNGNPRTHDDVGTPDTGSGTPTYLDMGAFEFQGTTVPGECNGDGNIDLDDYDDFATCLLGVGAGLGIDCNCFDFDHDGDVTLEDFGGFQVAFGG